MSAYAVARNAPGAAPVAPEKGSAPPEAQPWPDYNLSFHEDDEKPSVSCVSLGCWCGVAQCLNNLRLRQAAYPFDWNRTTIQGVIHFIRTGFVDFLRFSSIKPFPESTSSGGKAFLGAHHSVWHEDLTTPEGAGKYHRRIHRFFENPASRMLFIRVLNSSNELADGEQLLQVLEGLFPSKEVFLLLIADCQPAMKSFVVDGTGGKLLVSCIDRGYLNTAAYSGELNVYKDAILFGERCARGFSVDEPPVANSDVGSVQQASSCQELLGALAPFSGGPPQDRPYSPTPLLVPCLGHPALQQWPQHGPPAAAPAPAAAQLLPAAAAAATTFAAMTGASAAVALAKGQAVAANATQPLCGCFGIGADGRSASAVPYGQAAAGVPAIATLLQVAQQRQQQLQQHHHYQLLQQHQYLQQLQQLQLQQQHPLQLTSPLPSVFRSVAPHCPGYAAALPAWAGSREQQLW